MKRTSSPSDSDSSSSSPKRVKTEEDAPSLLDRFSTINEQFLLGDYDPEAKAFAPKTAGWFSANGLYLAQEICLLASTPAVLEKITDATKLKLLASARSYMVKWYEVQEVINHLPLKNVESTLTRIVANSMVSGGAHIIATRKDYTEIYITILSTGNGNCYIKLRGTYAPVGEGKEAKEIAGPIKKFSVADVHGPTEQLRHLLYAFRGVLEKEDSIEKQALSFVRTGLGHFIPTIYEPLSVNPKKSSSVLQYLNAWSCINRCLSGVFVPFKREFKDGETVTEGGFSITKELNGLYRVTGGTSISAEFRSSEGTLQLNSFIGRIEDVVKVAFAMSQVFK